MQPVGYPQWHCMLPMVRPDTSSGTMQTAHAFTGMVSDPSGLSYDNARYYDGVVGQFISADVVQGPNRYGYVGGNPETATDPTGQTRVELDGGGDGRRLPSRHRFHNKLHMPIPLPNKLAILPFMEHHGLRQYHRHNRRRRRHHHRQEEVAAVVEGVKLDQYHLRYSHRHSRKQARLQLFLMLALRLHLPTMITILR